MASTSAEGSAKRRPRRDDDHDDDDNVTRHARGRRRQDADQHGKRRRRDADHRHRSHRSASANPDASAASASDSEGNSSSSSHSAPTAAPKVLSLGSSPISSSSYYSHSPEFRHWLVNVYGPDKDRKHSSSRRPREYGLDSLSSKEAHRLFERRFVRQWNAGKLHDDYYLGKITSASSSSSRHWKFVSNRSSKDQDEVAAMRDVVDRMTNGTSRGALEMRKLEAQRFGARAAPATAVASAAVPAQAPAVVAPSSSSRQHSDTQYEAEVSREASRRASQAQRKAERRDARERDEELNPRATGREANMERRRQRNAANRDFDEARKGGGDVELPESTLMGGGSSFQDAMAARSRSTAKRDAKRAEREEEMGQRRSEYRAKEDSTMEMFRAMARERFG
ncbi:hypothetical protein BDZ90DRAFT_261534 [Jaminaea rosea]|uniref:Uncharacterized protein n=1 Tax=Jaminaea rosea TaxID=1569628 RepID=A0A316ULS2_9BASI|nr:hypothetical protein BDZ90DRAFT_261534 [Jaminaea rosea]PWN26207.1 hypothetical protein BDZ90DRAFT_261534 [Jaminaea rosea]